MNAKSNTKRLIAIVGPTASGKSDLAISLASEVDGEVISADSRQVYRGMDIGTGKVTPIEMRGIPHHLLDVIDPNERYSVNEYRRDADRCIAEIWKRGRVPILCGGTGYYIDAVLYRRSFPPVPPHRALRKQLARRSTQELYHELERRDPRRAATIDPRNPHRLIRALEIVHSIGTVPPIARTYDTPRYPATFIGIQLPKDVLYNRIHLRLLHRLNEGMVEEVARLHTSGVPWKRLDSFGLEYRYVSHYLRGLLTYDEMVYRLERAIRQYAKRQLTWFRRNPHIHWFTQTDFPSIIARVKNRQSSIK